MPPLTQAIPAPDPDVVPPPLDTRRPSRVSRRSLLAGAAGAGALGLAVASGATAAAGVARPDHQGPVTVYLRDAATGEMDVFAGENQVRLRDRALAAQLLRAIQ